MDGADRSGVAGRGEGFDLVRISKGGKGEARKGEREAN